MEEKKAVRGRGRSKLHASTSTSSSFSTPLSSSSVVPTIPKTLGRGRRCQQQTKNPSEKSSLENTDITEVGVGKDSRCKETGKSVVPCTTTTSDHHIKGLCKKGTIGRTVTLTTNFFKLVRKPNWTLYKFHVDFSPEEDRTSIRKQLMREQREKLGMYLFDGSTIFSINNFCPGNKALVLISKHMVNNEQIKIIIKSVGTVESGDFQRLQVFNIIIRECMSKMKLQLIKRNYFDKNAAITIPEHRLELWPGYITAMARYQYDILLQAEIIYKVLRRDTAYDVFKDIIVKKNNGDFKEAFRSTIIGNTVMTKYNDKTYRVDDVSFDVTPLSTFPQKTKNGFHDITYSSYYEQRYNVKIIDKKQPMLITKTNARDKRAGLPELVYLVPELCIMTGWSDTMRSNYMLMKSVANHTSVNPSDRVQRLEKFSERLTSIPEVSKKLTDWGLHLSNKLVKVDGRILPSENIVVGQNRRFNSGHNVDWTNQLKNSPLLLPAKMDKWVVIHPLSLRQETEAFVKLMIKCAIGMGITIASPNYIPISTERCTSYTQAIEEGVNSVNAQIITCILRYNKIDLYSAIKRRTIVDKPVPSQVILLKNITSRAMHSIATKVVIQMNCKIGGAPWGLDIPLKNSMIIGFDVCHDTRNKMRSFGAMVATMDSTYTRYFSSIAHHADGDELSTSFPFHVTKAIRRYMEINGDLPNPIMIYRDGVGEGDLENVQGVEVTAIVDTLNQIYEKRKTTLQLAVIIVTKRINTRLIQGTENPSPGTVVDDVITNPRWFDFFLISQKARHGTVSPTHYNVLHNTTNLNADKFQKLTYKLTHLYFNWSGTIRVPAPCQYAHKLAFLTSQNIGTTHSNMDRLLYYL